MATYTTNYNWTKPSYDDDADIMVLNDTIDAIDTALANTDANVTKLLAALAETIDAGAKNLLDPSAAVGYVGQSSYPISKSGVTYTLNTSTDTITLTDTASGVSTLRIPVTLEAGTYHVSGIPSGGSDNSYRADLRTAGGNTFITSNYDYGSGFTFTLSETTSLDYCIRVANGYTPNSVTVSPMICTKSDWDISQNYVPYRPSYQELYDRIVALENGTVLQRNTARTAIVLDDTESNESR